MLDSAFRHLTCIEPLILPPFLLLSLQAVRSRVPKDIGMASHSILIYGSRRVPSEVWLLLLILFSLPLCLAFEHGYQFDVTRPMMAQRVIKVLSFL